MVVDDNQIDHITAKYAIEDYSSCVEVLSAYDGQEALNILLTLKKNIDIIFLDINMPGMDGHEFLQEYNKHTLSSAVVVMLTSSDQESDIERSTAYPFVKKFLTKPLKTELIELLAEEI